MMREIRGLMAGAFDLSRGVGMGSSAQVEDFIFRMTLSTSLGVVTTKSEKPCAGPGLRARDMGSGIPSEERMPSTLVVKYKMNLLHCSSVVLLASVRA